MIEYLFAICCPFMFSACGNNTTATIPPPEYVFPQIAVDFDYSAWKDKKRTAIDWANEYDADRNM